MRYGDWITEAGRVLFRNLHVWVLAAPLLILQWAQQMFAGASMVGVQSRIMYAMNDPLLQRELLGANSPLEVMLAVARIYARILGIGLPSLLLGIIWAILAWALAFIVAGAVIHQAMPSHAERPRWQESFHVGLNRAPHLFLIRLILALPWLLVVGFGVAVLFLTSFTVPFSFQFQPERVVGTMFGMMWAFMCIVVPVLILWSIFATLFEPLAVQACVQEARTAWDALGRAWHVFWQRLGPVIVLALILFVLRLFASGIGAMASPITLVLQQATGGWAVAALMLWGMFALVLTLVGLLIQVFGWILYARAWPDLS